MDSLVVGLYLEDREDLVWELHGDLVHGKFRRLDVKDCNSISLGEKIVTSNDAR